MLYTEYSEEELLQLIDTERAEELRKELIRKGEVLPATEDVIFKNVMMTRLSFLSIILEPFLGLDREIIKKIQLYLLIMLEKRRKLLI